jgi:hypothetical protein
MVYGIKISENTSVINTIIFRSNRWSADVYLSFSLKNAIVLPQASLAAFSL